MTKLESPDVRNIILLILTTALMMVFFGQIPATVDFTTLADMKWYLRIAEAAPHIDPALRQPFAFRLLGPYLVGLLPIAEPLGFRIATIVLAFCLVLLFYYFLRYARFSPFVSLTLVILVTLNRYIFGWTFWSFFLVNDLLMLIFIMIMFLALWRGHWLVFSVTLVLGAMTREPTILMGPVALFYIWEKKELASKWRTVLVACVPGLVTLLLIRLFVPIGEGTSLTNALATYSSKLYDPRSLFRLLVNTFLPFTFIPLVYFRTTLTFFKTRKYLLLFTFLVFCTTLFGSNQERLMIPTFVVFFMLLGTILETVYDKRLTFVVLLGAGSSASFHYAFGNVQVPDANWTRALTLGAALVVTLYMIFIKRQAQTHLPANDAEAGAQATTATSTKVT